MLAAAGVRPGETVYDLGAGDGRIIHTAAGEFGARAVGVELHPERAALIRKQIRHLDDEVQLVRGDFYQTNLSAADIVTMYLLPSVNAAIRPKLERELRPGTRVVSHDFHIPGWQPESVEIVPGLAGPHFIYLYKMPGR